MANYNHEEYNYRIIMNVEANPAVNPVALEAARIFSQRGKPVEEQVLDEADLERFGLGGPTILGAKTYDISGQANRCNAPDNWDDGFCYLGTIDSIPQKLIDRSGGFCILGEEKDPIVQQPTGRLLIAFGDGINDSNDRGGRDMCGEGSKIWYSKGGEVNPYATAAAKKTEQTKELSQIQSRQETAIAPTEIPLNEKDPILYGIRFVETTWDHIIEGSTGWIELPPEGINYKDLLHMTPKVDDNGVANPSEFDIKLGTGTEYTAEVRVSRQNEGGSTMKEFSIGGIGIEYLDDDTNGRRSACAQITDQNGNVVVLCQRWNPYENGGRREFQFIEGSVFQDVEEHILPPDEFDLGSATLFDPKNPLTVNDDGTFEQPSGNTTNNKGSLGVCPGPVVVFVFGVLTIGAAKLNKITEIGSKIRKKLYKRC